MYVFVLYQYLFGSVSLYFLPKFTVSVCVCMGMCVAIKEWVRMHVPVYLYRACELVFD